MINIHFFTFVIVKLLYLIVSFCLFTKFYGQLNLVPNSSFEDGFPKCDFQHGSDDRSIFNQNALDGWFRPTNGSSNLLTIGWPDDSYCITIPEYRYPGIHPGPQTPRTGKNIIGLIMHSHRYTLPFETGTYREYMSIELNDTLGVGKTYCGKMFANLAHFEYATSDLGILLTTNKIDTNATIQI